MKYPEPITGKI